MLYQPDIMVGFSMYMHTKGQNSATSTTCNFERSMVTTSFSVQSKQDQNYPKTSFGDNLIENISLWFFLCKMYLKWWCWCEPFYAREPNCRNCADWLSWLARSPGIWFVIGARDCMGVGCHWLANTFCRIGLLCSSTRSCCFALHTSLMPLLQSIWKEKRLHRLRINFDCHELLQMLSR